MKKTIQKSFFRIRAAYRRLLNRKKAVRSGTTAEWLLDNYYIFAEEYSALRHLKTPRRDRQVLQEMLSFSEAYLKNEELCVTEDSLSAALSMHAPYEVVGKMDLYMSYKAFAAFLKDCK